jgi:hypothetical protein
MFTPSLHEQATKWTCVHPNTPLPNSSPWMPLIPIGWVAPALLQLPTSMFHLLVLQMSLRHLRVEVISPLADANSAMERNGLTGHFSFTCFCRDARNSSNPRAFGKSSCGSSKPHVTNVRKPSQALSHPRRYSQWQIPVLWNTTPGTQPSGTQPLGTKPPGTQPSGTQPLGTKHPGTQPSGTQPL